MIVVDASMVVDALVPPQAEEIYERIREEALHAPHLLDVEVLNALRALVARGSLDAELAASVRSDVGELVVTRHPHGPLMERAWELRDNLTSYDAVYVALAELLDCPLVTADACLAGAPGHHATIEVLGS